MSSKAKQVGEMQALTSFMSSQMKDDLRENIKLLIKMVDGSLSMNQYLLLYAPIYLGVYKAYTCFHIERPTADMLRQWIDNHIGYKYGVQPPLVTLNKSSEEILTAACRWIYEVAV